MKSNNFISKVISVGFISLMIVTAPNGTFADTIEVPAEFSSIKAAVEAAQTGDIIRVAAGVYSEKQIIIDKAISIMGEDADTTIIDGGGLDTSLTEFGLIRITADGSVAFTGFTLRNANAVNGVRAAVFLRGPAAGNVYLIANNRVVGMSDTTTAGAGDYGIYAFGGRESLFILKNEISQTGSNPILIEQHPGPTDISYNVLDVGVYGADAIFTMTYDNVDIRTPQKRNKNRIDMGTGGTFDEEHRATGITFASAFRLYPYDTSLGGGRFTHVQIMQNTFENMQSWRRGISLWNGAGAGPEGDIIFAAIQGNMFKGDNQATDNKGVQLVGRVTGTKVVNNHFLKLDVGIALRNWTVDNISGGPIGTKITANRFTAVKTTIVSESAAVGTKHHSDHVSP